MVERYVFKDCYTGELYVKEGLTESLARYNSIGPEVPFGAKLFRMVSEYKDYICILTFDTVHYSSIPVVIEREILHR